MDASSEAPATHGAPARSSTRSNFWQPWGGIEAWTVFAIALVIRLVYFHQLGDSPGADVPFLDEDRYLGLALALKANQEVGEVLFWQSPFYAQLLALLPATDESLLGVARFAQALVGAVTCALTTRLGTHVFDRRVGLLSGLVLAVYGPALYFGGHIVAATLAAFWVVVLLLLIRRVDEGAHVGWTFGLAVCGGLAILTRATFLPFVVIAFVTLAWRRWRTTHEVFGATRLAVLLAAGAAISVTPTLIERAKVTGSATVAPLSAGINLHIGNNEDRCASSQIRGYAWERLVREPFQSAGSNTTKVHAPSATTLPSTTSSPAVTATPTPTDGAGDRYFRARFETYVGTDPIDFMRGLMFKSAQLLSGIEIPRNTDLYLQREWSSLLAITTWRVGSFGFPFALLLGFATFGAIQLRKRVPWYFFAFLVAYGAAIVAVFVTSRYRLPMIPALAILAAAGAYEAVALLQKRGPSEALPASNASQHGVSSSRGHPPWVALAGATISVAISCLPTSTCEERVNYAAEYQQIVGTHHLSAGRLDEAQRFLSAAVQLDPDYAEAHYNLGLVEATRGRPKEAVAHWRKTLETYPDHAPAKRGVGLVLLRFGEGAAAHELLRDALSARVLSADDFASIGLQLIGEKRIADAAMFLRTAVDASTSNETARKALQYLDSLPPHVLQAENVPPAPSQPSQPAAAD